MEISTFAWRIIGGALQPVLNIAGAVMIPFKAKREPIRLPISQFEVKETSKEEVEAAIKALVKAKSRWRAVTYQERSRFLSDCLKGVKSVAEAASKAATDAHGSFGTGIGEELAFWIPVAMALLEYKVAMDNDGHPSPYTLRKSNNQYIADMFPKGIFSSLFGDLRVELWISPGSEPTQGRVYREKSEGRSDSQGAVSLVLGAGNHVNVVILDILHKLICDDEVVLVKMNPQNAYLGIYVEQALAPFFAQDFVKLIHGGTQQGIYLTNHSCIDNLHLTGSVQTFNNIVFGIPNPTKDSIPVLKKKVSAELGCFTPAIIVPGDWTDSEMHYVAATIISGLINNSSHNCCAFECIVTMESWSLREKFIEILTKKLDMKERQIAWYHGSKERYEKFLKQFPDALVLGQTKHPSETFPWVFAPGLKPNQANTQQENWCGVLQEICLPGSDPAEFMSNSVEFCNDRCWGNLTCSLIIQPQIQAQYSTAFNKAVADLKYGNISINAPSIFNFLPAASWGAFPGNEMWNISSGNCVVHNTSLFDHPEKSVMYCPWILQPLPVWADISNKTPIVLAFLSFIQNPSILTLVGIVPSLIRAAMS